MIIEFRKYVQLNHTEIEEIEFEDDSTDEQIETEFKEWVWNDIGDNYNWNKK